MVDAVSQTARRSVIAALEEEIADRAIRHLAACTAVTREGVARALEAWWRRTGRPARGRRPLTRVPGRPTVMDAGVRTASMPDEGSTFVVTLPGA